MTHQEIEEKEIIERYVLHRLAPEERLAFQEHYFACDECFERAQTEARFIAGVRASSRSGVLAADRTEQPRSGLSPAVLRRGWLRAWAMPALAACLLAALTLTGLWALSLRRENRRLAERAGELAGGAGARTEVTGGHAGESGGVESERLKSEQLRRLEERVRELESGGSALEEEREALRKEVSRLKEQLAAAERRRETEVAQLGRPEVNVPVRNIYPVGDAERGARAGEVNRIRVPRGTERFVLILGDYKPGYPDYRLEIRSPSGRLAASRAGLRPDQGGELSVMLSRGLLGRGRYRLKLYGRQELIAEYLILIE